MNLTLTVVRNVSRIVHVHSQLICVNAYEKNLPWMLHMDFEVPLPHFVSVHRLLFRTDFSVQNARYEIQQYHH